MSTPASGTIGQAQRALARRLSEAGIETGALDARLLVCAAAGLDHAAFVARENELLAPDVALKLDALAGRSLVAVGGWLAAVASADVVVSNPPYIESGAIAGLDPDVRDFDPRLALDGGPDGLDPYRIIAQTARSLLRPQGLLAVETGAGQGASVSQMFKAAGFGRVSVHRDLGQRDRAVLAHA